MNITVHSDQAVDVEVFMTFIDTTVYEFKMRLQGRGPAQFCVVGRTPQDVVSMELQYCGNRFGYPIQHDGEHLKAIHIFGGRDQWSQLLREAAIKATAKYGDN